MCFLFFPSQALATRVWILDIGLKVARVGDDGAQVGKLVNKFGIIVADM